jgi:hypothetical protein
MINIREVVIWLPSSAEVLVDEVKHKPVCLRRRVLKSSLAIYGKMRVPKLWRK